MQDRPPAHRQQGDSRNGVHHESPEGLRERVAKMTAMRAHVSGGHCLGTGHRDPEATTALVEAVRAADALQPAPDGSGVVRLGTPEDFATTHLSDVLACFARFHPQVALQVKCDFTVNLLDDFSKGRYDLILFKREPQGPSGGTKVWRDVLDWVASPRLVPEAGSPIPLILAPGPDVYRKRALSALDAAGRDWRIVYISPSLAGLQAAIQAGLGVTVLPTEMIPVDRISVSARLQLPKLPDTEIVLYRAPGHVSPAAELLPSTIVAALEQRVGAANTVAL